MVLENGGPELGVDFDVGVVEPALAEGGGVGHQGCGEIAGRDPDGLQSFQLGLHGCFTEAVQPGQVPSPLPKAGDVLAVGQGAEAGGPQRFPNAQEHLLEW